MTVVVGDVAYTAGVRGPGRAGHEGWTAQSAEPGYRAGDGPLHLVIDADNHEVRAVEMMDHRHDGGEVVPGLLAQLPKDERVAVISGDGAHDTRGVYEAFAIRQAALLVPPRRNGKP
jgi:hypothetical protein